MLDVFSSDAFSTISLTASINKAPFAPSRIGDMGLFVERGVTSNVVWIEERAGLLSLLPTAPRGAPSKMGTRENRTARSFAIPHIPYDDSILAEDVASVRRFGSEDETAGVAEVVNDRLIRMRKEHEVTLEHLRIGAVKGIILDSDGSTTIFNLFNEFGVSQSTHDFVFSVSTTKIAKDLLAVVRLIEDELGAAKYDHIHGFAGDGWFDDYSNHDSIAKAFDRFQEGSQLRDDNRKGFEFPRGVVIENYRGKVNGVNFVPSNECHFFPVGVTDLFQTSFAPGDFVEAVGTVGLPVYAKQEIAKFGRGVDIHTQSNPLPICTRPKVLVKGTQS